MAFKLPFTVGCDEARGCCVEVTVHARSQEEANAIITRKQWKVISGLVHDPKQGEYYLVSHLCPDHAVLGKVNR